MAEWNDADWLPVGEGPLGGVYQNKNNGTYWYGGSVRFDEPDGVTIYGGSSKAPSEKYLEFGSQGPGTYQVDNNGYEIPGGGFKPKASS